jgi:hypothetical protein
MHVTFAVAVLGTILLAHFLSSTDILLVQDILFKNLARLLIRITHNLAMTFIRPLN